MCVRGWRVLSISSRRVPKALRAAKQLQGIQGIQGLQGGRHLFRGWDSSNSRWESFESPQCASPVQSSRASAGSGQSGKSERPSAGGKSWGFGELGGNPVRV